MPMSMGKTPAEQSVEEMEALYQKMGKQSKKLYKMALKFMKDHPDSQDLPDKLKARFLEMSLAFMFGREVMNGNTPRFMAKVKLLEMSNGGTGIGRPVMLEADSPLGKALAEALGLDKKGGEEKNSKHEGGGQYL